MARVLLDEELGLDPYRLLVPAPLCAVPPHVHQRDRQRSLAGRLHPEHPPGACRLVTERHLHVSSEDLFAVLVGCEDLAVQEVQMNPRVPADGVRRSC